MTDANDVAALIDHLPAGLRTVADALAADYRRNVHTCHLGGESIPDRADVEWVTGLCLDLLFPGFFGAEAWADGPQRGAARLLAELSLKLREQVARALRHRPVLPDDLRAAAGNGSPTDRDRAPADPVRPRAGVPELEAASAKAAELTTAFLARLPALRDLLADDVRAAYDGDPAAKDLDEPVLCYPGVYALAVYRVAHELEVLGVPLMPRMMTELAHARTGIDIHPGAVIGRHFFIDHGTGVVIGETTIIGERCKLYQGVTLGALSFPRDERGRVVRGSKRHPTLQDGVTVYSNASILGGATVIGEGAVIGGNVFVTASVPPRTIVKGSYETTHIPRK